MFRGGGVGDEGAWGFVGVCYVPRPGRRGGHHPPTSWGRAAEGTSVTPNREPVIRERLRRGSVRNGWTGRNAGRSASFFAADSPSNGAATNDRRRDGVGPAGEKTGRRPHEGGVVSGGPKWPIGPVEGSKGGCGPQRSATRGYGPGTGSFNNRRGLDVPTTLKKNRGGDGYSFNGVWLGWGGAKNGLLVWSDFRLRGGVTVASLIRGEGKKPWDVFFTDQARDATAAFLGRGTAVGGHE